MTEKSEKTKTKESNLTSPHHKLAFRYPQNSSCLVYVYGLQMSPNKSSENAATCQQGPSSGKACKSWYECMHEPWLRQQRHEPAKNHDVECGLLNYGAFTFRLELHVQRTDIP